MWSNRFTPKGGELRPPPQGVGRMVVTGGAGVLALLGGAYLSMVYSKRKQERDGTNPMYEQVLAHVGTKSPVTDDVPTSKLPTRSSQIRSSKPMEPPVQEHRAKHDSVEERTEKAKTDGNGDVDQARREEPAPQRKKGNGKLVSQSDSDFMKSYKKDK
ncbi:hypothetical protein Agabi119p4_8539 [Agaricus bisporus var. burnettii]|uniref:Uncharacterized protein n=1 Tax=Agaricus bisporus var. burnettii TaxID=192524 RepID=A0A8H7C7A7_AGABI|nr:hypothetical protein Agabi119p4_8539 [Agaricus bisporus var. burnettii]